MMFFNVASSECSAIKDPFQLMYKCSLPDFLEYKEYVETLEYLKEAADRDVQRKIDIEKRLKNVQQ